MPLLAILCYGVSLGDGGYKCKSINALFVGFVDTRMGMVASWVDVEVAIEVMGVEGLMDTYRFATACETLVVGFDVGWEGPSRRFLVVWCKFLGMGFV